MEKEELMKQMMEDARSLKERADRHLEKYIYYVIALNVAAIGFSIKLTIDAQMELTLLPLGIAILCWLVSVLLGFRWLRLIRFDYGNSILRIMKTYQDLQELRMYVSSLVDVPSFKDTNNKAIRLSYWHYAMFLVGMVFFMVWRCVEMSQLSEFL